MKQPVMFVTFIEIFSMSNAPASKHSGVCVCVYACVRACTRACVCVICSLLVVSKVVVNFMYWVVRLRDLTYGHAEWGIICFAL